VPGAFGSTDERFLAELVLVVLCVVFGQPAAAVVGFHSLVLLVEHFDFAVTVEFLLVFPIPVKRLVLVVGIDFPPAPCPLMFLEVGVSCFFDTRSFDVSSFLSLPLSIVFEA
jgi:hypothetical protein